MGRKIFWECDLCERLVQTSDTPADWVFLSSALWVVGENETMLGTEFLSCPDCFTRIRGALKTIDLVEPFRKKKGGD